MAATLLRLATRGVIGIEGIDSERYTLTILPRHGETAFEEAVLDELRPQGKLTATATLTGPPCGERRRVDLRGLTRIAVKEAKQARLVRVTLTALSVLIPASLAMGIVALIASDGTSWLAWMVTVVGPLLALVATVPTGVNLSGQG